MKKLCGTILAAVGLSLAAFASDITKHDPNMEVGGVVVTNGVKWIDGRRLPIEGRAFDDVDNWYDRLPAGVTTNVNGGVRSMKHHTAGMQFRFYTDSRRLVFKWIPTDGNLGKDHMPASGVSGIDVYRFDALRGRWLYVMTGRIKDAKGGSLELGWAPGTPCLVNLPLYNGIKDFKLGVETNAIVSALGPRKSGVEKPVVFYGTSITHGGCASRPGMSFVNIVGRELDVPVVNLGFSGSGVMELEMSDILAQVDASCYVLDCLWNMGTTTGSHANAAHGTIAGRNVEENYEPFIRNLRSKRPDTPIVMAGQSDVFCGDANVKENWAKALYDKLVAEGWKNLVFLPKIGMYCDDFEGTVDGIHPNDWGMMSLAKAYGGAVETALSIGGSSGAAHVCPQLKAGRAAGTGPNDGKVISRKVPEGDVAVFRALRPPEEVRTFRSEAVDAKIASVAAKIKNKTVRDMFEACYPNTLDTTVKGDGYVITGDIDAMWLRDSAAQVWPYLRHVGEDAKLKELVRKLILRQFANMRLDPYANAFYADEEKEGEWKDDMTDMKPGLHERKYEIDSLCYPIRLAHGYWKASGDTTVFSGEWENTLRIVLRTFREQQRKGGQETSYRFQRWTKTPVDTLGNGGRGNPVRPVGLIASAFRPSDDATILPFLVPSNFFAVDVLRKSSEILRATGGDAALAKECDALADEVHDALMKHAVVDTERWGRVYAFEVDGYGGRILMDDANAPSLLSLPYLCGVDRHDPVYVNTRRMILSPEGNPYCFRGKALEGIGSPHTGLGKVWPMSLIMRILTSEDDDEIRAAMKMLVDTTAGTGFMHESVNADDPADFTRSWFAWANTLFGEVVLELVERGKEDLL